MREKGLCRRLLAAALALSVLGGIQIPLSRIEDTITAGAADTQMNAAAAIGLSDEAPEGFDEDDPLKNPYGRKTVTFGDANEVIVSNDVFDGDDQMLMIGEGGADHAHDMILKDVNGNMNYYDSTKSAGGNFDGNTEGKINQYVVVKNEGVGSLAVCDGKTGESHGELSFAFNDEVMELQSWMNTKEYTAYSFSKLKATPHI